MFSSTLKRSVATLGVMTGLLAAAGPASAQFLPTGTGVKAPANARTQVGSEGVKDNGVSLETVSLTFKGELTGLEPV
jgi:hypothetical protein